MIFLCQLVVPFAALNQKTKLHLVGFPKLNGVKFLMSTIPFEPVLGSEYLSTTQQRLLLWG